MKYIRTKNEIFEVIKEDGNWIICISAFERMKKCQCCLKKHAIIKQADTIEELCDEFVVAYEDGARIVYGDLEWAKVKAKASLELGNKSIIYGAIWTDKGLIYKAKMKGVLPNGEIDWELL